MELFLLQLFIFLASAAIAVPLAKKLGLGSVLGYLVAGIVIGPYGVSLIHDVEDIMHFTEFGVVMMLFLVGLELRPSMLWQMRMPILGMGGSQVLVSAAAITGVGLMLIPWQQALAVGMILALSSTAIVLQTLQEKGQMDTGAGRSIFSVLLFQDLAVIPMLAGLPLLATLALGSDSSHGHALLDLHSLPQYLQIIITVSAIVLVLVLGKFACGPMFRVIAKTGVREIFVAAALALVIGTSVLMLAVGLSPALGAFLAGVMLADSEFRHELESDIEPFKGLLLGIFFISIGASLNFTLIGENPALIAGLTVGLILLKWLVLYGVGLVFNVHKNDRSLFAIALAQGGEFAFVLFQFSKVNGVLGVDVIDPLISAVAISMFLTPIMFIAHDKFISGKSLEGETQSDDAIHHSGHKVILAGFGRTGTDVGRFLLSAGIKPVILDHDAGNISVLRRLGFEVYFGDATRLDLLEAAGAAEAELLIIAIGDQERSTHLVDLVKKHYPNLKIVASAHDRKAAFALMDQGIETIHRETLGSALTLGQDALSTLGMDPYEAYRLRRIFYKKDCDMMPLLHKERTSVEDYVSMYKKQHDDLEALMNLDRKHNEDDMDKAWTAKNPAL